MLRVSTMVPTFSILFKQVTGELITSLDEEGGGGVKHRVRTVTPTTFQLEAFAQSDEGSPGRQPMGGCRGLPVQEGDALQLDVDIIQALRAGNDRRHYVAAGVWHQHARRRQTQTMTFAGQTECVGQTCNIFGRNSRLFPKIIWFWFTLTTCGSEVFKWGTRPPGWPPGGAREATDN